MGDEDELQPSSCDFKRHKSSKKLLSYCGGMSSDSVPRKLRSAIKKCGHECISPPLPVSRKQRCFLNGVEKLRKSRPKKSRQKNGHVTKDEEEVAETLYALADMFETNKQVPDKEPLKLESPTLLDVGSSISPAKDAETLNVQNESKKTDTRIILGAASHSWSLVNPTAQVVESQSSGDAEQLKLETSTTEIQSYLSPSSRFPAWSGKTYRATQPNVTENSFAADKIHYPQAVLELKKPWKRCPTHVRLTRLIKLLQKSVTSKEILQKPTPTCEGFEHSLYLNNQGSDLSSLAAGDNGSNTIECSNRAQYSVEALKRVDGPYQHPQNLPGMHFSFQNSRYSTFGNRTSFEAAALQVQTPPYRSNTNMAHLDIEWSSSSRNGVPLLHIYETGKTRGETQLPG